ncbi:MAG: multiple sugar transport system permease protein [Microbacteriaceae bacterium]|jgi:multiple sugar transport system permease protein|nr:putative transporter permease protein [Microbacteriaceae bacterium]MDQ1527858.1 multiple sugar transport system permease protein [Microbacteriaceae bacterium]MDQ1553153.1 multiple sugar transport system permease protein [Microbacteriaceae bacterium]MDQ1578006.1 multiple sugar transport system permease protein [Microbacteriaceae bacterium]MDQ1605635.1 multiple sugar transport system permease protein [Microbacteriaceae bacterium]
MTELKSGGRDTSLAATKSVRRRDSSRRRAGLAGYAFVSGYVVFLAAFGIFPTLYAFYLALTNDHGQFVGLGQFAKVIQDFRFAPAFANILIYLVMWLVVLVVLTVVVAVILRSRIKPGLSAVFRFLFYIPGALAGVASVLVWLFMLAPGLSPVGGLLNAMGFTQFAQVIAPGNLPVIFVLIAFWTGAGGWIVVMYGALNNIPDEILEAARMDGAGPWKSAWHIQIPMIRKWIAYMTILAFAAGTQLFVEPQLLQSASLGRLDPTWSPNQLAYVLAFQFGDFNGAAAVSIFLLLIGLVGAGILVTRSGLFKVDGE